ncbi:MAG TPA: rhamnulokinase family protein [Tepidisphaeraceae bacterium]|jgi:sugar (pentulose or hexulose) kinase|nr:rhamnulokinase family protein [Tepidisphaeraceae bacterium]
MPKRFLAFDLGAESGRAVLGRLAGQTLTVEDVHRFPTVSGTMNGHLHWNLLGLWEQMKIGLRKGAELARKDGGDLDGIGVDTWGVDYGLIDSDGAVLGDPYHYRDRRTDGMMEAAFARVGRNRIFNITGIQFMQFNTLFQLMATAIERPQLLKAAQTMLFTADLFNYLFSGVAKAEYSLASTSQMVDARKKTWAMELIESLGVPTHLLPEIVPAGTVLGPLRADVAGECDCGGVPVIASASHDTACAVAAVPAPPSPSGRNDWCFISSGTWSLMGTELAEPLINEKSLALNYTNEGGVGGSIRFLKNIMGLWLVQECRRHFQREGHDHTYAELTEMARRAGEFGALVNPDHAPFGFPGEMPIKIEQFCRATGQTPPSSRGEFTRTCLESLALTYRRTLEKLEEFLGRRLATIHVVGGGCQNELLNQMTASACGRPVIAGPSEATAIGNLLVQAMAVGEIKSLADARAIVRGSFPVRSYEPRDAGRWDEAYSRFVGILGE